MVNSLSKAGDIHEKYMYHDKCDIFLFDDITDDDGAILTTKSKTPIYTDIPCKITFSLRTWDNFQQKPIDTTPYSKQPRIHVHNRYEIEKGYYAIAKKVDAKTRNIIATYEGQLGLPSVCSTHQEITIDCRGAM